VTSPVTGHLDRHRGRGRRWARAVLPGLDGRLAPYGCLGRPLPAAAGPPARSRVAYAARMWSPTRWRKTPRPAGPAGLGRHAEVPAPPVAARTRVGRRDGHRAARHGPGLGGHRRADPPFGRRGGQRRRRPGLRRRHRPACRPASTTWRRPACLRGAARGAGDARRRGGADGQPGAGRERRRPGHYAKIYGSLLAQVRRPVLLALLGPMFDPALAGSWGSATWTWPPTRSWQIIAAHPTRSTASRCRCWTPTAEVATAPPAARGRALLHRDDFHTRS